MVFLQSDHPQVILLVLLHPRLPLNHHYLVHSLAVLFSLKQNNRSKGEPCPPCDDGQVHVLAVFQQKVMHEETGGQTITQSTWPGGMWPRVCTFSTMKSESFNSYTNQLTCRVSGVQQEPEVNVTATFQEH